jgi:hypothetical protein
MKKEKIGEESITLTSPASIIQNSLKKREAVIRLQNQRLPEAIAVIDALKAEDYPDSQSIKAAQERVRLWQKERRWFSLLKELCIKIESNRFPNEKVRLLALAQRLMPDTSQREWREIFSWFGIGNVSVRLAAAVNEVDIESIEKQLNALMIEDNVILATSLEKVIQYSPNSKQYRNVKQQLIERGWYWYRRRKIPTSVIRPPLL